MAIQVLAAGVDELADPLLQLMNSSYLDRDKADYLVEWVGPFFYSDLEAIAFRIMGFYDSPLDTIFQWGTASALFVPFDGNGLPPVVTTAERAPASQLPPGAVR